MRTYQIRMGHHEWCDWTDIDADGIGHALDIGLRSVPPAAAIMSVDAEEICSDCRCGPVAGKCEECGRPLEGPLRLVLDRMHRSNIAHERIIVAAYDRRGIARWWEDEAEEYGDR